MVTALVLLLLAVYGTVVTFLYVNFVCKKMFPAYRHEQFLAFFGMLTGTASTGMILLREIDGSYRTPASENLVYQTLPAIVFGFPLMFLAPYAATSDLAALITCIVVGVCFVVLNVLLFRRSIFKKQYARAAAKRAAADGNEVPSPEDADTGASDGEQKEATSDTGTFSPVAPLLEGYVPEETREAVAQTLEAGARQKTGEALRAFVRTTLLSAAPAATEAELALLSELVAAYLDALPKA